MLYSRYACPMELMSIYINQGRFGEFVSEIIRIDEERKQEEAEKEEDNKLWLAYLMSMSNVTFSQWKTELTMKKSNGNEKTESLSMTDEQVDAVKNRARGILAGFSPT